MKRTAKQWKIIYLYRLEKELGEPAFLDLEKICRLNRKAVRSFEFVNGEYNCNRASKEQQKAALEKDEKIQDACHSKAEALAEKNGWKIDFSGGLWWSVEKDGREILAGYFD